MISDEVLTSIKGIFSLFETCTSRRVSAGNTIRSLGYKILYYFITTIIPNKIPMLTSSARTVFLADTASQNGP